MAGLLVLATQITKADQKALLADGQQFKAATIAAYDSEGSPYNATLKVGDDFREVESLVLWGEPKKLVRRPGVLLADGSRLLSDRTWSPGGLVRIDAERIKIRRGTGWVDFAREAVGWVILDAESAGLRPGDISDPLRVEGDPALDLILLNNGDRLTGKVVLLGSDKLSIEVAGAEIDTTLEEVAALRLAPGRAPDSETACLVGMTDGSLLNASRFRVADGVYSLEVAGATIAGKADTIALVQPLGGGVRYLSDLDPADYRHTPYLDLAWPYAKDRGLRGNSLVGGGRRAAKGVAIHSAARLIYRLDGSAQRFQANLAVADQPTTSAAKGSVIFRVYLVKDGKFEPAYESDILRFGDAAVPIDLDASRAAALALVIDYADNGDAGDDALWMNARLVKSR